MVITISLSFTTSSIDLDMIPPNSFKGSALLSVLLKAGYELNAFKLNPALKIFLAIGKPIKPIPIKPIFLLIYFLGINSWKFCVVNSGKNITHANTIS